MAVEPSPPVGAEASAPPVDEVPAPVFEALNDALEGTRRAVFLAEAMRAIPAALRRLIWTRSGTCDQPSCPVGAHRTDIDHVVRVEHGGRTVEVNLSALCRRDHQTKDDGYVDVERTTHGDLVRRTTRWRGRFVEKAANTVRRRPASSDDGGPAPWDLAAWPGGRPPAPARPRRAGSGSRRASVVPSPVGVEQDGPDRLDPSREQALDGHGRAGGGSLDRERGPGRRGGWSAWTSRAGSRR